MRRKIFRSMAFIALVSTALVAALVAYVLFEHFDDRSHQELLARAHDLKVVLNAEDEPASALKAFDLDTSDARITLIAADGQVVYDNRANESTLGSHLDRPEVQAALATGMGESSRLSATLNQSTVYLAVRLDNGMVLRLSETRSSLLGIFQRMVMLLALISIGALALSLLVASRMTRALVKPINSLDLNHPLNNDVYEELTPLLTRIAGLDEEIRKKADALMIKQQEFEAITAGMGEGLILVDHQADIVSINPAALRILGAKGAAQGDYSGKSLWTLSRSLELNRTVREALRGCGSQFGFSRDARQYTAYVSPVLRGEEPGGSLILMTDITDRARAEQLRREFSANVSHELKTPLTSISGYAEMLEGGMIRADDVVETAGRIRAEAQRMITLISDIIKLSSLDEHSVRQGMEPVNLKATAGDVAGRLNEKARSRDVSIAVDAEQLVVTGVPAMLDEMVACLVDNAITYNRPGGSVTIRVRNDRQGPTIEVADTGIGIPMEHQERVFERFYRVDKSRSKKTGGTGLGLSIAKHIAEYHGAKISLTSQPDVGTSVRVVFGASPDRA